MDIIEIDPETYNDEAYLTRAKPLSLQELQSEAYRIDGECDALQKESKNVLELVAKVDAEVKACSAQDASTDPEQQLHIDDLALRNQKRVQDLQANVRARTQELQDELDSLRALVENCRDGADSSPVDRDDS